MKDTHVPAVPCPGCGAVLMLCTSQVGAVSQCPACQQEIGASVRPITLAQFQDHLTSALNKLNARRSSG